MIHVDWRDFNCGCNRFRSNDDDDDDILCLLIGSDFYPTRQAAISSAANTWYNSTTVYYRYTTLGTDVVVIFSCSYNIIYYSLLQVLPSTGGGRMRTHVYIYYKICIIYIYIYIYIVVETCPYKCNHKRVLGRRRSPAWHMPPPGHLVQVS